MRNVALQMINEGMYLTRAGYRILLGEEGSPSVDSIYNRPGGVDQYYRPGGTDSYLRP